MNRDNKSYRIEKDGLGEVKLPVGALYGIHSQRACDNFPIANRKIDDEFINNIALIKKAAAIVNGRNGELEKRISEAIVNACNEIMAGQHHDSFIVDCMQGGAGTSDNMNANEVIANLAILHLGGKPGDYALVHPIDHVNLFQSTNDVIPSAGRLTQLQKGRELVKALEELEAALLKKADEFHDVFKVGRTQLQDAVPMRMSQELEGYASMICRSRKELNFSLETMKSLSLGATAIGTGINASESYLNDIIPEVAALYGEDLKRCENLFDGTQNEDDFAFVSATIKVTAVKLSKMASDLRLLSSGPKAGIGELILPARQSGSSIMPGKINPVIPEALNQASFLVIGHDSTIAVAVEAGQLELNAFLPVILYQLFEETDILTRAVKVFTDKCIKGLEVNRKKCEEDVEECYSLATALNPVLGYDVSTELVKKAASSGKTIRQIAMEEYGLSRQQLSELLDPERLTDSVHSKPSQHFLQD